MAHLMAHLLGRALPDVALPTSSGATLNPQNVKGRAVYFCYPYTGRPGVANPQGWDDIAGAHGSTPQALAYAALYEKFQSLAVSVFGVSLLSQEWIADFAHRNTLPFELLSDHLGQFSQHLELQRFSIEGVDFLRRITVVAAGGIITQVKSPVLEPHFDAAEILAMLL